MYLRAPLFLSLITAPLLASDGFCFMPVRQLAPGKHLILVSLGAERDGTFIPSKELKFKVDRDEKLAKLNTLLNEKKGSGDLRIRNNYILFSNTPNVGVLDTSNVRNKVMDQSYESIASLYPDHTLATLGEKLRLPETQDMKFRFILTTKESVPVVEEITDNVAIFAASSTTNSAMPTTVNTNNTVSSTTSTKNINS